MAACRFKHPPIDTLPKSSNFSIREFTLKTRVFWAPHVGALSKNERFSEKSQVYMVGKFLDGQVLDGSWNSFAEFVWQNIFCELQGLGSCFGHKKLIHQPRLEVLYAYQWKPTVRYGLVTERARNSCGGVCHAYRQKKVIGLLQTMLVCNWSELQPKKIRFLGPFWADPLKLSGFLDNIPNENNTRLSMAKAFSCFVSAFQSKL